MLMFDNLRNIIKNNLFDKYAMLKSISLFWFHFYLNNIYVRNQMDDTRYDNGKAYGNSENRKGRVAPRRRRRKCILLLVECCVRRAMERYSRETRVHESFINSRLDLGHIISLRILDVIMLRMRCECSSLFPLRWETHVPPPIW